MAANVNWVFFFPANASLPPAATKKAIANPMKSLDICIASSSLG
jgi:hypothetical protein